MHPFSVLLFVHWEAKGFLLGSWERGEQVHAQSRVPSHGFSHPVAEFHSLCPDGKGYTQDNNIVNYGIPAHRGKP